MAALALVLIFAIFKTGLASTCVKTQTDLNSALSSASDGDVVCIADGTYSDWYIQLLKDGVTLQAETGGGVTFKGNSGILLKKSRITVKDFVFTAPLTEGGNRSSRSPIEFGPDAVGSQIQDILISNHSANILVKIRGQNNEVHHCTFTNKTAPPMKDGKENGIANIISVSHARMRNNKIHHNKLMNYDTNGLITHHKHGSAESIFVKVSQSQGRDTTNYGTVVSNNYLYQLDTEHETIGFKSTGNYAIGNAIVHCFGGISLRHGKNNTVNGNFILGRPLPENNNKNYGINVHEENQIIENNWVMGIGGYHGIKVVSGNGAFDCDSCHVRAKNVTIRNNTLIDSRLILGRKYPVTDKYSDPEDISIIDSKISVKGILPMINGYNLEHTGKFDGKTYKFIGTNNFTGPTLAYSKVFNLLSKPLADDHIEWEKKTKNLGSYGMDMIKKIECAAGPRWMKKPEYC